MTQRNLLFNYAIGNIILLVMYFVINRATIFESKDWLNITVILLNMSYGAFIVRSAITALDDRLKKVEELRQ